MRRRSVLRGLAAGGIAGPTAALLHQAPAEAATSYYVATTEGSFSDANVHWSFSPGGGSWGNLSDVKISQHRGAGMDRADGRIRRQGGRSGAEFYTARIWTPGFQLRAVRTLSYPELRHRHEDGDCAAGDAEGMTLPPRWRKAVLTVHVITAVGWLGTDLVQVTLGIAGLAGADPAVVYPAMGLVGTVLFVPLSALVWLVGVVNAAVTPWGLMRHWWVVVKLALTTLMLVLVMFALRPTLSAALELGAALPDAERTQLVIAPSVSSTLLVIATVVSTYKPWGRTRWRARPQAT